MWSPVDHKSITRILEYTDINLHFAGESLPFITYSLTPWALLNMDVVSTILFSCGSFQQNYIFVYLFALPFPALAGAASVYGVKIYSIPNEIDNFAQAK